MNYIQLTIPIANDESRELLIAALSEQGIEGFEENDTLLKAFVAASDYQEDAIAQILQSFALQAEITIIEPTNWNAEWEANFEPVVIGDFCTIRAHFHNLSVETRYDIIITPKMSFGTGHHATTRLMVAQMAQLDCSNKHVFDFGTGTGVLAILAEHLGASRVVAIDNDEWSYENTQENIVLNHCERISVSMDSIENFDWLPSYHIILANINRHILLDYMEAMEQLLYKEGILLMSGLLTDDEIMVCEAAISAGFTVQKVSRLNNWISILCTKR
ncbi:MAG: 50S ribosomal protein L11 methyltransferase [Phycisphaerales bacterium]|nr:50S ribosomal protein L11 methyltransferase [Phycisphaerales bacterium]